MADPVKRRRPLSATDALTISPGLSTTASGSNSGVGGRQLAQARRLLARALDILRIAAAIGVHAVRVSSSTRFDSAARKCRSWLTNSIAPS